MFANTESVCTDPGTPFEGRQTASSYEPGATVVYICDNPRYNPDNKAVICQRFGFTNMFGWFQYNMLTRRIGDAVKTPLGGRRPVCWGKNIIIFGTC